MTTPKKQTKPTTQDYADALHHTYKELTKESKNIRKKKRISKNTAYKRGARFEYRVKKHYEKLGYYVIRKYASKGYEDLICLKSMLTCHDCVTSEVLLIQCKNLKKPRNLSKSEIIGLTNLARQTGAKPLFVFNNNHKLEIVEL